MAKAGVIHFITESRKAHGVHERTTREKRMAMCTVRNARQSEYYQAENAGMKPEYQFDLTLAEDWHGERLLEYQGQVYRVIRTYETAPGGLEIIAGRYDANGTDETDQDDSGSDSEN